MSCSLQGMHEDAQGEPTCCHCGFALQADNILVSEDGEVVLADFGVAAAHMRPVSMVNMDMPAVMAKTFVGTPCWMAPEVMQQTEEG